MKVRVLRRIREVARGNWDRLLASGYPFLRWDWLDALEETGCAHEKTGWVPSHIVVEAEGEIVGACPLYLKLHSMGEFVFDYEWAELAHRLGVAYYPKLVAGIPFTPVTGPRFLTGSAHRAELIRIMGDVLVRLAREHKISSVHVNFCLPEERDQLTKLGFIPRAGLQFHWRNRGYRSFDDYLLAFRSDRRTKIKRERRELERQGITIRPVEGAELSASHARLMFELYERHVAGFYYGHQYLNRDFFDEVFRRLNASLCLLVAERNGWIIAGTFNLRDEAALYGRYWGAFDEERYLHFNVCYYSAIEYCIQRGLERFEAGAGGSFKQLRGLEPEPTTSMHYIVEENFKRMLEKVLREERKLVAEKRARLLENSQLKRTSDGT